MKNYQALLILISALLITYGAIWITPYVFTDDYPTYVQKLNNNLWEDSKRGIIAVGRPIYAIFLYFGFTAINSIDDLRILRFIGVIGVAVTSWILYLVMRRNNWPTWTALGAAFIVGTLPAFEVYSSWSITFIFPWACALAGCASYILGTSMNRYVKWILSIVLLVMSFSTYQPAATIFWAFSVIQLFRMKDSVAKDNIRKFVLHAMVYLVSAASSLVVQKVMVLILGAKYANKRAGISHDILGKIKWFFNDPFVDATNFHNVHSNFIVTLIASAIIIFGLSIYFTRNRAIMMLICTVIIPLTYAPNLVAVESWSGYRTQVGLGAVVAIYFFIALWSIINRFNLQTLGKYVLFICVSISSMWTMYNVTLGFVIPQYVELASIRLQIDETKLPQTKKIYIITNQWNNSMAPFGAYDEFGYPSSAAPWVPSNSVYIVMSKIDTKYHSIPVEVIDKPEKAVVSNETMVIDTRKIENIRKLYFE